MAQLQPGFILAVFLLLVLAQPVAPVRPQSQLNNTLTIPYQKATSTTPYMAAFQIQKSQKDPVPWGLYPSKDGTVWIVTTTFGNPSYSQIINFTLGAGPRLVLTQPPYPDVGLVEELLTPTGERRIAGFTLEGGAKPVVYLSLNHPVVRDDPIQIVLSIFHEVHHYLNWQRDPASFQREKALPPDDPIEKGHEAAAVNDLLVLFREGSEVFFG